MFKHTLKMKNTLFALAAMTFMASCGPSTLDTTEAQDGTEGGIALAVDVSTSTVAWYGHKPFVENYGHAGTVGIKEGTVGVTEGSLVSGTFVIDMQSILCTDEALPQEKKDYLVGHLKSADFFAVDSFATANFEITQVVAQDGEFNCLISGNLTLRGITHNIQFPANVTATDSTLVLKAPQFNIDRKLWEVTYASTRIVDLTKDNLIADDLGITLTIKAKL